MPEETKPGTNRKQGSLATAFALSWLMPLAALSGASSVAQAGSSSKLSTKSTRTTDCGSAKSTPVASFPFNPLQLIEISPPVIEPQGAWQARLDTGMMGPGVAYLIASRQPGLMQTQGGTLLVDLAEARILQAVRYGAGQDIGFLLPIPDRERLCSQRIRVQAVIVAPGGTYLSNAFDLTLGR